MVLSRAPRVFRFARRAGHDLVGDAGGADERHSGEDAAQTRPVSRSSNLTLTIDTRWSQNYGYRPIEVTVHSPKPVTARSRDLRSSCTRAGMARLRVEQDFKLPQGSTSATTTLSPCRSTRWSNGQFYWWDVRVDGVKDNEPFAQAGGLRTAYAKGLYGHVGLIVSHDERPQPAQRSLVGAELVGVRSPVAGGRASFPTRWIDYTCFDVVTLSLDELADVVPRTIRTRFRRCATGSAPAGNFG